MLTPETTSRATAHGDLCRCQRCVGFKAGNEAAVRHGAYAVVQLAPRAAELADDARARMPMLSAADGPALQHYGMLRAQLERAYAALAEADGEGGDRLARLREDARGWHRLVLAYERELGLTPLARSRLGVNVAIAGRHALDEYLAERYGDAAG